MVRVIVESYDDYKELKQVCKEENIKLDDVSSIIVLDDILFCQTNIIKFIF